MAKINNIVNEIVVGSTDVQTRIMTPKEAVSMGALALFGEKYGEEVRVVFMGKENNGFSQQNCAEVLMLKILKKLVNLK